MNERKNKETYNEIVSCSNCSFHGEIEIQRGKRVDQTSCPNCGVEDLRKSLRGTLVQEVSRIFD